MNQQGTQPVQEFRAKGITAAIWRQDREEGGRVFSTHSIRIRKRYRNKQTGDWCDTDYLFVDDLPALRLVAEKAYEFIALTQSQTDSDQPVVA